MQKSPVSRIRIKSRYYYVLRRKNGRILDLISSKGTNKAKLSAVYKKTGSLHENVQIRKFTKVYEKTSEYKKVSYRGKGEKIIKKQKISRPKKYQVIASAVIDGKTIYGASRANDKNKEDAAEENLYMQIYAYNSGIPDYDGDIALKKGFKYAQDENLEITLSQRQYLNL
jgi:hypothetical protein